LTATEWVSETTTTRADAAGTRVRRRRQQTHAAIAAGSCAGAVALVYVLAFGTRIGMSADAAGVPGKTTAGPFRAVLRGAEEGLTPVTGIVVAALILVLAGRRGFGPLVATATIMAGSVATAAVGWIVAVSDPFGGEDRRELGVDYFPSGHSAGVMALALAAAVAVSPRRRLPAAMAGAVAAGLLGIGNLVAHAHHPSDVAAGYLIAGAWGAAATAVVPSALVESAGPRHRTFGVAVWASLLIPALAIAGFVSERPADEVNAGFLAAAGVVALIATAIAVLFVALAAAVWPA